MPRVQDGSFGASERFAVSPGRERDGYLELPGGPSGHPLSPFYRSGFDDWANGVPTPFLPGSPVYRLLAQTPLITPRARITGFRVIMNATLCSIT